MNTPHHRVPLGTLAVGRNFQWYNHLYTKIVNDAAGVIAIKAGQQRPRRTYIGRNALVHPA